MVIPNILCNLFPNPNCPSLYINPYFYNRICKLLSCSRQFVVVTKGRFFSHKQGEAPSAKQMSGGVVKKSGEMAASQSGGAAVEFVQERSFESTKRPDEDAAEVRSLVSQPQRRSLSRLQKRAPAKMQLKRLSPDLMGFSCRSPIPLLSPILVSPLGIGDLERFLLTEEAGKQNPEAEERAVTVIPTNGWQHPAAPFFSERICSFSNCFV